jgi:hypothetical protein
MTTLTYTRTRLHDAISALCDPSWHDRHPLPSRYHQLNDALTDAHISKHTRTQNSNIIPCQIDALKLKIHIDRRTAILTPGTKIKSTTGRLQEITTRKFRPQDTETLEATTAEIQSWTKAIDDLFAPKPIYLPNPCPQCGHTHTHRRNDDGDTIRTPALAITVIAGAVCQQCHAKWPPEDLMFFGRVLGYHLAGITA